jgi:hypothetical protein
MTEESIKEEKVTKNAIEKEEGLDLDELQSVSLKMKMNQ